MHSGFEVFWLHLLVLLHGLHCVLGSEHGACALHCPCCQATSCQWCCLNHVDSRFKTRVCCVLRCLFPFPCVYNVLHFTAASWFNLQKTKTRCFPATAPVTVVWVAVLVSYLLLYEVHWPKETLEERVYVAYTSRSQLITEGNQGKESSRDWSRTVEEYCSLVSRLLMVSWFLI